MDKIKFWVKYRYDRIVNSIAFYPAFIAFIFLVFSFLAILFDYSETGKDFKGNLDWWGLKDASTARNILSVVAGGIISLTVFSFSMVMIVLNQAASQMSNRVLNRLIGNKFQQVVLGIYIGTIVFSLFLLSTIQDRDSGVYIPALSIYFLIICSIIDIFLFIYFLHYITQSVKYEIIIQRITNQTLRALRATCYLTEEPAEEETSGFEFEIVSPETGIYTGYNRDKLIAICNEQDCTIKINIIPGAFILKGIPVIKVNKLLSRDVREEIQKAVYFETDETIQKNFFYGFRQLAEVAVKALSPGVNDPGTAALALRALFTLFTHRICFFPENSVKNSNGELRIITTEPTFIQIFEITILPIWDYGKNDRIIQREMYNLLQQFVLLHKNAYVENFLEQITSQLDKVNK